MDTMQLVIKRYFESSFENIDVREYVMNEINRKEVVKKKNKKFILILSFSLLLLICTGFIANQLIEIRNENGDVIWSLKKESTTEDYTSDAFQVFETLNIPEGQGVEIYIAFNNPDQHTLFIQEPIKLESSDELTAEMKNFLHFNLEDTISDQYKLKSISIHYQYEHLSFDERASIIDKGDDSEDGIAFHELKRLDTIISISAAFDHGNNKLQMMEMDWSGNTIYEYGDLKNEEIIEIKDKDVIYRYNNGFHEIFWIDEGKMIKIELEGEENNKEAIIKITEEVLIEK